MKKKLIPFLFSLILISSSFAREIKIQSENLKKAQESKSFFKFVGESTKLGLITTEFEGYAKEFTLSFKEKVDSLEDIKLIITSHQIDTDNDSRNEKMWELCLEDKKFPTITISTLNIDRTKEEQEIQGEMGIRNQVVPITLKIKKLSPTTYNGSGSFKLSEAKIPDPSIAIASVNDEFKISFQVDLAE